MGSVKKQVIIDGKRLDGRKPEEVRPINIKLDVISQADGSAEFSFGNTRVIASVYGPKLLHPKHLQNPERGILRCKYIMAPFSVDERKSPGPDRRSIELSKVIRLALEPAIFLEEFPRTAIDIFVEVIQADGSTRVTGINAASLALASAGIPMRDLVAACSVGKIDNTLVIDLNGLEDNNSEADVAFSMIPTKDVVTLFQADGRLTKDELKKLLSYAKKTCLKVYEEQKKALKQKYKTEE
jgi:exosome complex component RRP41